MQPHITLLLFHRFCCFTRCQFILANSINWLAIPLGGRIRQNDHFLLVERSTNCVVTIRATSGERILELSTNLACWPFKQNFRPLISVSGWRMVELQPKGLWFYLNFYIWLQFPYYSLLLCFIWTNIAWTSSKIRVILPVPSSWVFCNPMNVIQSVYHDGLTLDKTAKT